MDGEPCGSGALARDAVLEPAFFLACHRLEPSVKRAVMRAKRDLERGPLPGPHDFEGLGLPAGVAWIRPLPAIGRWLVYRFDDAQVQVYTLLAREPGRVD